MPARCVANFPRPSYRIVSALATDRRWDGSSGHVTMHNGVAAVFAYVFSKTSSFALCLNARSNVTTVNREATAKAAR